MKLQAADLAIIVAYLITMVVIGWTLRKKARANKLNYLMGGKSLPWYMLGLSDAGDMFDISGTMWMVSLCFIYGLNCSSCAYKVIKNNIHCKWVYTKNISTSMRNFTFFLNMIACYLVFNSF